MFDLYKRNIGEWPFPLAVDMWKAGDHRWIEISDQIWWNLLEAVPPVILNSWCFAVGEATIGSEQGPVHAICVWVGRRYFLREVSLSQYNPIKFKEEIISQYGIVQEDLDLWP